MRTTKFTTNQISATPVSMANWLQTKTNVDFEITRNMGLVSVSTDATNHDELMKKMFTEIKKKDSSLSLA